MRRLGIVDVGSNTIRLVVFVRQPSGTFRLRDDIRERVRLGAGAYRDGVLRPDRLARAIELIRRFADYGRGAGLDDLRVIGTSALRDTSNGGELVAEAERLGLDVTVLSGKEESRYGTLAVANAFDLDDAWVMDLGGGSAQVSRMEGRRWITGEAYPLGAVRLTESHLERDPPSHTDIQRLEDVIATAMGPVAASMRRQREPLVVMGGAVRNLARAVQKRQAYPVELLHGYWLTLRDLEQLTDRLLELTGAERASVSGIHRDRGDVILAAALVFRWLLRHAERKGLLVSGDGVREGVLYHQALRAPHLIDDVARSGIEGLMEQHVSDRSHAENVQGLAAQLFDVLEPLHGLRPRDAILLDAAAALHEIGLAIDFYRRQKHGAFLLGSLPLDGFTHREQALVALLVRNHRKGKPKLGRWRTITSDDDAGRLDRLLVCLRLAIALDRTQGGRVSAVDLSIEDQAAILRVPADSEDAVEVWAVRQQCDFFETVIGRPLEVVVVPPPAPALDPRLRPTYDRVVRP